MDEEFQQTSTSNSAMYWVNVVLDKSQSQKVAGSMRGVPWSTLFIAESPALALSLAHSWAINICSVCSAYKLITFLGKNKATNPCVIRIQQYRVGKPRGACGGPHSAEGQDCSWSRSGNQEFCVLGLCWEPGILRGRSGIEERASGSSFRCFFSRKASHLWFCPESRTQKHHGDFPGCLCLRLPQYTCLSNYIRNPYLRGTTLMCYLKFC